MTALVPSLEEFRRLAAGGARVPVVATLLWDELTPLSAFARLQGDAERAFLFESVVGGERVARYSFLGVDPEQTFSATRAEVSIRDHRTGAVITRSEPDPLRGLEECLSARRAMVLPGLPAFLGGAVGYVGYDAVRYFERLPAGPPDDRGLPDVRFDFYDDLVIFDHVRKVVLVSACASGSDEAAYAAAAGRIAARIERLAQPTPLAPAALDLAAGLHGAAPRPDGRRLRSNFTQAGFEAAVRDAQEFIRAGDIFQVVLSQRLSLETPAEPLNIYRALRVINPSPFMFLVKTPGLTLVGASPEIMCRVEDGVIHNRPLAGTRRRGATPAEDQRLRDELLADPKERAEHIMLVDLGRNDVGRVARLGSVALSDVMSVEYYSHVMHISTHITGELRAGLSPLDALRATLPVGTVSGAPKIRAMQIIDELEPTRRGPYGGAVGYVDHAGNLDTCIALRTMVIRPAGTADAAVAPPAGVPHWRIDVQAGAGIVADSVPAHEFEETLNKARSLLAAIELAERIL